MEQKEQLHLKVENSDGTSPAAIDIRYGELNNIRERAQQIIGGIITAPGDYALFRKTGADKTLVLVDLDKATIVLIENQDDEISNKITGALKVNPELAPFQINRDHKFGVVALRDMFKINKRFFPDGAAYNDLLVALTNFKANADLYIEKSNDNRGNINNTFKQKLDAGFASNFNLEISLFVGFEKVKFPVELCFDLIGQELKFWLVSSELAELMETEKERLLKIETDRLSTAGYLVLNTR